MARYDDWSTLPDQLEGAIASGRMAGELSRLVPTTADLSSAAKRDAALAELLANQSGGAVFFATNRGYSADNSEASATSNTAALTAIIAEAAEAVSGASGATVVLPQGVGYTNAMVTLPNRVALRGQNGRGSIVKAASAHTGPWMFNAVNGTSSMFGSWLTDLHLDCNSVSGLGGIKAEAWQENSGLRRVIIQNFRTSALQVITGYGGASHCLLDNIEFFGSASGATYGIDLQQVSAVGGFMLQIRGATITGASGGLLTAGINVAKDSLIGSALHFEHCTNGIVLDGLGTSVLDGVTGASTVTDVLEIASGFTGRITVLSAMPRGATNVINNVPTGETLVASTVGSIGHYFYGGTLRGRYAGSGTAHVAGDYVAHANWGTSPTITPLARDTGGRVSVLAQATTGANPTLTLTFKNGTWTTAPAVICSRGDAAAPTTCFWAVTTVSATAVTFTLVGTPTAGNTYILDFVAMGK